MSLPRQTHCVHGHDLTLTRRVRPDGRMYCGTCSTLRQRTPATAARRERSHTGEYTPCPLCGKPKARQASKCRACSQRQVQPDPQLSLAPFTPTEDPALFLWAHGVGRRWGHAGRGERPATGFEQSAAIYGNSRLPRARAAL